MFSLVNASTVIEQLQISNFTIFSWLFIHNKIHLCLRGLWKPQQLFQLDICFFLRLNFAFLPSVVIDLITYCCWDFVWFRIACESDYNQYTTTAFLFVQLNFHYFFVSFFQHATNWDPIADCNLLGNLIFSWLVKREQHKW